MDFSYSTGDFRVAAAMMRAALEQNARGGDGKGVARRFVTVSRQAGAAGRSFARQLVERLNILPHDRLWSCWDQELVEKVSAENDLERTIVARLEDEPHNWVVEMLEGLSTAAARRHPDELQVYRRVAMTVQALAEAGNVVVVGRGGVFLTAGMRGGVHVRIVAPRVRRVANVAERDGLSAKEAAAKLAQVERARDAFYKRHWPDRPLGPEEFTMTFNSDKLGIDQMVQAVLPMLRVPAESTSDSHAPQLT